MSPPLRRANAPVDLDASALRAFVQAHSVDVPRLADAMPCDRSYLSKLQSGAAPRCSSAFFARLCRLLGADPQTLMRFPEHYDADAAATTAEMLRPAADPAGPPLEVSAGGRAPDVLAAVPEQRGGRHRLDAAVVR